MEVERKRDHEDMAKKFLMLMEEVGELITADRKKPEILKPDHNPKFASLDEELADILAYPVKQAFLVEKGVLPDPGDVFGKRVMEAAGNKFNQNEWRGQVTGYGKVWLK